MEAGLCIDQSRIFSVGFSFGAMFTNSLAQTSDAKATSQVYNNVVYTNVASSTLANSSGGTVTLDKASYVFRNNIFHAAVNGPEIGVGAKSNL